MRLLWNFDTWRLKVDTIQELYGFDNSRAIYISDWKLIELLIFDLLTQFGTLRLFAALHPLLWGQILYYTIKSFSGILHRQMRDIKWPSLDGVKLRMEWKLQTFRIFLSLIVKLHLVVDFTNPYCIIPNLVRNYT